MKRREFLKSLCAAPLAMALPSLALAKPEEVTTDILNNVWHEDDFWEYVNESKYGPYSPSVVCFPADTVVHQYRKDILFDGVHVSIKGLTFIIHGKLPSGNLIQVKNGGLLHLEEGGLTLEFDNIPSGYAAFSV